jgi:NTP pyrophosphatase (non-canonical NTP hydrolase)
VQEELADVLLYLVRLADVLNVDLGSAAESKMKRNALKHPASADNDSD